ncbi:hypothetical protein B0H14DRAFT_3496496 [Mycena olivaceomarginata]|nr:hypothetical protein B0H14DRAFT_3496496 [Mycena olivaceomarginata]
MRQSSMSEWGREAWKPVGDLRDSESLCPYPPVCASMREYAEIGSDREPVAREGGANELSPTGSKLLLPSACTTISSGHHPIPPHPAVHAYIIWDLRFPGRNARVGLGLIRLQTGACTAFTIPPEVHERCASSPSHASRARGRGWMVGGNDATTAHACLCPTRLDSGLRRVRATEICIALRERAQLGSRARRDAAAREARARDWVAMAVVWTLRVSGDSACGLE